MYFKLNKKRISYKQNKNNKNNKKHYYRKKFQMNTKNQECKIFINKNNQQKVSLIVKNACKIRKK